MWGGATAEQPLSLAGRIQLSQEGQLNKGYLGCERQKKQEDMLWC